MRTMRSANICGFSKKLLKVNAGPCAMIFTAASILILLASMFGSVEISFAGTTLEIELEKKLERLELKKSGDASIETLLKPVLTTSAVELNKKFAMPRNDIDGLLNFAKVSDELYRGQQPERKGFEALKKMGIKTVVSLRAFHSDRSMLKGLGLNYYRVSFNTWHAEDEDVLAFLKIIKDPKYHPVFVHCQHGADRTGTMCAIYRVALQGWSMEDAIAEMKNFGFHEIWTNLPKYLKAFDTKKILEELNKTAEPKIDLVE